MNHEARHQSVTFDITSHQPKKPWSSEGADKCAYSNQCEADAAGATDCCRNPIDEGCTQNFDPVECGKNRCYYVNECVAEKSGYDPESCVPGQGSMFPTPTPPAITTFGSPANVEGGSPSGSNMLKSGIGCLVSTIVAFLGLIM